MMMKMVGKVGIDRKWAPVMLQLLLQLLTMMMKMGSKVLIDRKLLPVVFQLVQQQISCKHIQAKVEFQAQL